MKSITLLIFLSILVTSCSHYAEKSKKETSNRIPSSSESIKVILQESRKSYHGPTVTFTQNAKNEFIKALDEAKNEALKDLETMCIQIAGSKIGNNICIKVKDDQGLSMHCVQACYLDKE